MSKEEILRNQSNANSVGITAYLSEDGFVWKMILNAMQRFSDQNTKPFIDEIAELKSQLLISEQKVKLNYNCAVEFDAKLKASKSEANEADYTEEQVNELIETICFRLRSGHFKTLDLKISAINRIKNEDYKHWKTTLNKTRNNK